MIFRGKKTIKFTIKQKKSLIKDWPASLGRDLQLWWPCFRIKALSLSLSSSLHGPLFRTWLLSQHGVLLFPITHIVLNFRESLRYSCLYTHIYVSTWHIRAFFFLSKISRGCETTRVMPHCHLFMYE